MSVSRMKKTGSLKLGYLKGEKEVLKTFNHLNPDSKDEDLIDFLNATKKLQTSEATQVQRSDLFKLY